MSIGYIAHFITNKNKGVENRGFVAKSRHIVSCVADLSLYLADCRPNVVIFEELSDGAVGSVCGVLRRAVFDYGYMSVVVSRALCLWR